MPSKDGTLTSEEKERIGQFLKTSWTQGACLCGHNQWQPMNVLVGGLALGDTGVIQTKDKIIPFVPVACSSCGNTMFLSAAAVGIIVAPDSK
jgi:hypothetical protein